MTQPRKPSAGRPAYFESLDLIRGLAALMVLVYHVDFMFGLRHGLLTGGYLAVDLFFVLSGFVLSLTYGQRVADGQLGFRDYLVIRLARLYPLFLATTVVGFAVMTARFDSNNGYIDTLPLVKSGLLNLFMLPTFAAPYGSEVLFPFNGATWSIFFELVASLLFFFVFARLGTRTLATFALASGMWFAWAIWHMGTADVGWGSNSFLAGFPRVFFSFIVGMLIHRRFAFQPWTTPPALFFGLLIVNLALVQGKGLAVRQPFYDAFAVGLVLPLLVAAGAGVSLSRYASAVARFLGEISYGVYLNQNALIIIAAGFTQAVLGQKVYDVGAWVGFVFVPLVMLVSFATFHLFEDPSRRLLRHLARRRPPHAVRSLGESGAGSS